jgi:hypothetical protein
MASWMVRLESLILATEGHSKPVPGWIRLVWSTSWLLASVSTLPMSLVAAYKKDPGYRKNAGITCSSSTMLPLDMGSRARLLVAQRNTDEIDLTPWSPNFP